MLLKKQHIHTQFEGTEQINDFQLIRTKMRKDNDDDDDDIKIYSRLNISSRGIKLESTPKKMLW